MIEPMPVSIKVIEQAPDLLAVAESLPPEFSKLLQIDLRI